MMKQAEQIRRIVSCPATDLKEVAPSVDLSVVQARVLRLQFIRYLKSQCPVCGDNFQHGWCYTCKAKAGSHEFLGVRPLKLLKKMRPNDILMTKQCFHCERSYPVRVGRVLSGFQGSKGFVFSSFCSERCSRLSAGLPANRPGGLCHRPFEVLQCMKLPNRLQRGQKAQKSRKTPSNQR